MDGAGGAAEAVESKNLYRYLEGLQSSTLDQLYIQPPGCLAVFSALPVLAKHYIMRMLFLEGDIQKAVVDSWARPDDKAQSEHNEALKRLKNLRILTWSASRCELNQHFRRNLRVALCGGGHAWTGGRVDEPDKNARSVEFLDQNARERWESVLQAMVRGSLEGLPREISDIIVSAGFMERDHRTPRFHITNKGFQFLLQDIDTQVWVFMVEYLNMLPDRRLNLVEALTFLFQLSFLTLGQDYPTEGLSETQATVLQDLRAIGLVYRRKSSSRRYYPSRLAINLASGASSGLETGKESQGFIIVETNFRLYAYTDSDLQVALLNNFVEMRYRFPNMAVGCLTRESVRRALINGITAGQIVRFLIAHAHPQAKKSNPPVPPTVVDQIFLWSQERERLKFASGYLYDKFDSADEFRRVSKYAADTGVLLYSNESSRSLVIASHAKEDVTNFLKRKRA